MGKKSYKDLILVLIYQTSGTWSWYQIERELGFRGIGGRVNSASIAKLLIEEGLVESKRSERNNPIYFITDKGKEKVQELLEKYGSERYAPEMQSPNDYE